MHRPSRGSTLAQSTSTIALHWQRLITGFSERELVTGGLFLLTDPDDTIAECDEDDNTTDAGEFPCD